MAGDVRFERLSKRYGNVWALRDLSLCLGEREILAIVGPSGSGKTTLLNMCAGITAPTSGRVLIDGDDITDAPIEVRNIGVVFQSYALFPHLSVLENIAFPLRTKRHSMPYDVAGARAKEMLRLVGLRDCEHRKPRELSGGEQQRVALARAVVYRPRLLLLDEPLGALDPNLKQQLQEDILRLRDELGITIVYVTHDQQEAMSIADHVAVLRRGELEQVGSPRTVYEQPANEFVAGFVGEANLIRGRIECFGSQTMVVDIGSGRLEAKRSADAYVGRDVVLLVRPEAITTSSRQPDVRQLNRVAGVVKRVNFLGSFVRVVAEVSPGLQLRVNCSQDVAQQYFQQGQTVELCWQVNATYVVGGAPPHDSAKRDASTVGDEPLGLPQRETCEEAQ